MHSPSRRNAVRLVLLAAAASFACPRPAVAEENVPLAIQGYDPVAYFTIGSPVPGLAKFEYQWDERRYRFSRPEHRELFKTDPVRYAPQFADFCAVSLARGQLVEANPQYWLVSGGRLYIFGKQVGPDLFRKDLAANVANANGNRVLIRQR